MNLKDYDQTDKYWNDNLVCMLKQMFETFNVLVLTYRIWPDFHNVFELSDSACKDSKLC